MNIEMKAQIEGGQGFIAALDQSGGSTPKALSLYGVMPEHYNSEAEMFSAMHAMRSRIILSDAFTSEQVIGAILFERTMDDTINDIPVAELLWQKRGIVPFLKIDKGLEDQSNGVQLMKPMPGLSKLLARAVDKGVFGTKERSVVHEADAAGIDAIVAQQIQIAREVCTAGLVPIIEPEVNIHSETKAEAEALLLEALRRQLDALVAGELVMLKLTLPTVAGLYDDLANHPNVLRIVALSGGYSTQEASALLTQNAQMIASFSRALTEGLNVNMSDAAFNEALGANIHKIFAASVA